MRECFRSTKIGRGGLESRINEWLKHYALTLKTFMVPEITKTGYFLVGEELVKIVKR